VSYFCICTAFYGRSSPTEYSVQRLKKNQECGGKRNAKKTVKKKLEKTATLVRQLQKRHKAENRTKNATAKKHHEFSSIHE